MGCASRVRGIEVKKRKAPLGIDQFSIEFSIIVRGVQTDFSFVVFDLERTINVYSRL